ncbi:hypothetical protein RirG_209540 [Rhizophagus irregularis DAOM 197198w]|uniref:Uncharacterized protein n=1 Tax=Rhizophagus irregularis (strain DAOM 197198w) TaxID=1432141 RepID=A0A015IJ54_RHIIW|nr:hypothetical protein RirG_209540 [Rhizophagus irregularis DAOM 197198w]
MRMLRIFSDSSIDNESIKEVEMAYFTKNLGVSTIIHLTVLMECPATSPDGVVTVFSIQGWKNHMNAFNDRWYSEVSFFGNIITPERPPDNIKDNWQMMIKEAIEKDDVVTSGSIIQGNMLKAYFNKETLQEIHMSLNNIDKLRYLVAKTYKNLYPFEQHIFQSVYSKQFDLHNYVIKIDFFGNELVLIVCMLEKQAQLLLQHLECFRSICSLNLELFLGDLDMGQMKGLGLALHSLDTTREWEVHITNIFFKEM